MKFTMTLSRTEIEAILREKCCPPETKGRVEMKFKIVEGDFRDRVDEDGVYEVEITGERL